MSCFWSRRSVTSENTTSVPLPPSSRSSPWTIFWIRLTPPSPSRRSSSALPFSRSPLTSPGRLPMCAPTTFSRPREVMCSAAAFHRKTTPSPERTRTPDGRASVNLRRKSSHLMAARHTLSEGRLYTRTTWFPRPLKLRRVKKLLATMRPMPLLAGALSPLRAMAR